MDDETSRDRAPSLEGTRRTWLLLLLAAALSCSAVGCGDTETYQPPVPGEGTWILVDTYHTRIQNPIDYELKRGDFNYQGVYGYRRVFDHLEAGGYHWNAIRDLALNERRLEGYDVLFINLLHEERPDFTASEIELIKGFVHDGGGLFIIADHSNVYRHAERINPILEPMGIEVLYNTILDLDSDHQIEGSAWIVSTDLSDHAINEGVELVSLQTGGPFRTEHGTAFTSDDGMADYWNPEQTHGFYGNWRFDGDETIEPRGRQAIMAAAEYGAGRVVVAGDQNMFGDAWVHFGDNFEQVSNIFEWVAGRDEEDAPRPLRALKPRGLNVGIDIAKNDRVVGKAGRTGYFGMFSNFNRERGFTGHASPRINPRDDVLWFPEPRASFDEEELRQVESFLAAGKPVIVSLDPDRIGPGAVELIHRLAPDFTLQAGEDQELRFDHEPAQILEAIAALEVPRHDGALGRPTTGVPSFDLSSIREPLASYESKTLRDENGEETGIEREPFLHDLRSDWGDQLLAVERTSGGGVPLDVARIRQKGNEGPLIIVLHGTMFRNQSIGYKPVERETPQTRAQRQLQFALMSWLERTAGDR